MLDNCLTASERPRNGCNTALGDREEHVYDSLSCYKRSIQRKLLHIWTSFTNRPLLHHGKLFIAVFCRNNRHYFLYRKFAGLDLLHSSGNAIRNHDLLFNYLCLLYRTQHVAGFYFVADLGNRNKLPFLISLQGSNLNAALKVISRNLHNIIKRTLNSVINTCDKTRSKFNGHRRARRFYRFAWSKT